MSDRRVILNADDFGYDPAVSRGIVRAMSESSRVERAIASAEGEDFDLRALVAGCAEGYRELCGTRELRLALPTSALPFHGAPELLAQARPNSGMNGEPGGWPQPQKKG